MSIRSTVRITGVAKNTVAKLLCDMGCACADYHHRTVRQLTVQRLQCDWSFVGAKKRKVTAEQEQAGWGDVWTWTAIDVDTKLCVTYHVGDRGKRLWTIALPESRDACRSRPMHRPYLAAVEKAFGGDADYAQLHKIYGAPEANESGYSSATCIGCDMKTVSGVPRSKTRQARAL